MGRAASCALFSADQEAALEAKDAIEAPLRIVNLPWLASPWPSDYPASPCSSASRFPAEAIGTAVIPLELASGAIGANTSRCSKPWEPRPGADTYPAWTKLSNTILRPALSKSTVSLLPSTVATVPVPNFA